MKKAFTLLELLVVIGIIAVLLGMGAVSYSTAQKKARDAKRKSDLQSLQNCFEQYYAYNNNYKYIVIADSSNIDGVSYSCGSTNLSITDPLSGSTYHYTLDSTSTDGSTYRICALAIESGTGSPPCLSNQQ